MAQEIIVFSTEVCLNISDETELKRKNEYRFRMLSVIKNIEIGQGQ